MKFKRPAVSSALPLFALFASGPLFAVDYNNAGGNQYWGNAANWSAALPNGPGTTARMLTSGTAANQILLLADSSGTDSSFTVGTFTFGSAGAANGHNYRLNNVSGGTGQLVFDVSSGNAALNFTNMFADTVTMQINTGILLNDNLAITMNRASSVHIINGAIGSGASLTTGITIGGTGTLQLGGAGTYTGATTINAGATVKLITGDDRLSTGTTLTVNGGASSTGTLDLNTRSQKVAGLSGGSGTVSGIVTNNAAGSGTATLTVDSTSVSSTFAGVIKNGATAKVALTKAGAGTSLTLTGVNTYTGATTVNGGSLIIDGSLAAGSVVAVNAGGLLGGSGTIGGTTTLAAGAMLSAGSNSAATLTFSGTLDIAAAANDTAAFVFTLGTSFDKIIAGALTLGTVVIDAADFGFTTGSGFADGQSYTLFESTSVSGTFTSFLLTDIGGSGINGTVALDGNNIVLTTSAIPEPSTYALLLGGASVLLAASVRFRRRS